MHDVRYYRRVVPIRNASPMITSLEEFTLTGEVGDRSTERNPRVTTSIPPIDQTHRDHRSNQVPSGCRDTPFGVSGAAIHVSQKIAYAA